jgi:2-polyprenyl-6-methoxyphenol hydroxylase-like FAD-dependent oxidoreductase
LSTIAGYVIDGASLPAPGFGHVLIGGSSVVLAYEIGEARVRVMFDQPIDHDSVLPCQYRRDLLASLPAPFRDQVATAMNRQKALTYRSAEIIAHATSRGSIVLVGDAGGSCHPLTATGMTVGIRDAIRLRDALRMHNGNLADAVMHYDVNRRRAQRSRLMVASALHDVCSRQDPEARVLRAGLLRYWQDPASRPATMAILAMTDDRITSAFWHFFRVMWHGLVDHWQGQRSERFARFRITAQLIAALGAMTIKQANLSIKAR